MASSSNLAGLSTPVTAAYHDAMVALGLESPTAPVEQRDSVARPLSGDAPFHLGIDLSDPSSKGWFDTQLAIDPGFAGYRFFSSVELERGLVETSSPNYASVASLGRPEMFKTYMGNSNREVGLTVTLMSTANGDPDGYVKTTVRWLKSLQYAVTNGSGVVYAPPALTVQVSSVIFMRALLTGCTPQWGGPWSFDGASTTRGSRGRPTPMKPHSAVVSLGFTEVSRFTTPQSYNYDTRYGAVGDHK